jgi:hypothetical protein
MKGMASVGVIQGNSPIICHHETLSYYFDITIRDDIVGVAIALMDVNFKKNKLLTILTNDDLYYNGDCPPIVIK